MNRLLKYKYSILILLFAFAVSTGCSERITDTTEQKSELIVSISPGASDDLSQEYTFILTITGPGIVQPIKTSLLFENGLLTGTILVPAGPDRIFIIEAFDETGELIYSGRTVTDVESGVTAQLSIDLHPQVPMIKLSPTYYYEPFGSLLAFKVKVYNMNDLSSIEINIGNHDESPGKYSYYWSPEDIIINPDLAESSFLEWWTSPLVPVSANFRITNRYTNSIVDESGYRELATVYYRTYFNEGPPKYLFNPNITAMLGMEGDSLNTENIYCEGAVADLFYYTDHRVGYWKMDWESDSIYVVIDSSPNKLHGTACGTFQNEGAWGNARFFNGTSDFIEVPDDDLLDIDEGITFSFWIYIEEDDPLDTAVIFSKMSLDGPVNYSLLVSGLTSPGNCSFLFSYGESSNPEDCLSYNVQVPDIVRNDWWNVIFSYQFGEPSSAIFVFDATRIDGEWSGGTSRTIPPSSVGPLTFGKQLDTENPLYFKGGLDQVELYNVSFGWDAIRYAFFPR
ncbi:hypothetical protein J7M07_08305 [bacterium]|nr:hypothetical protein [bacterium]